jgi:hypothetical protein
MPLAQQNCAAWRRLLVVCRGHVCMVFEKLGPSLFDFLRRNGYKPFALVMVRCFHSLDMLGALPPAYTAHTESAPICKAKPPPTHPLLTCSYAHPAGARHCAAAVGERGLHA